MFVHPWFFWLLYYEYCHLCSVYNFNKDDILKFSKQLYENYVSSKVEILTFCGDDDKVALRYKYYASTIENPSELMLITKVMVIWEFEDGKIIRGFQSSIVE